MHAHHTRAVHAAFTRASGTVTPTPTYATIQRNLVQKKCQEPTSRCELIDYLYFLSSDTRLRPMRFTFPPHTHTHITTAATMLLLKYADVRIFGDVVHQRHWSFEACADIEQEKESEVTTTTTTTRSTRTHELGHDGVRCTGKYHSILELGCLCVQLHCIRFPGRFNPDLLHV